jgi:hypothetical protein
MIHDYVMISLVDQHSRQRLAEGRAARLARQVPTRPRRPRRETVRYALRFWVRLPT